MEECFPFIILSLRLALLRAKVELSSYRDSLHQEKENRCVISCPSISWHCRKVLLWLHHTRTAKLRLKVMAKKKGRRAREISISHIAGVDLIPGGCRASKHSSSHSWRNQSQHSHHWTPIEFIGFYSTGVCVHRCQPRRSLSSPPPHHTGSQKSSQQTSQASAAVWVHDTSLRLWGGPHSACELGTRPFQW